LKALNALLSAEKIEIDIEKNADKVYNKDNQGRKGDAAWQLNTPLSSYTALP
jgi:hypothetical protein